MGFVWGLVFFFVDFFAFSVRVGVLFVFYDWYYEEFCLYVEVVLVLQGQEFEVQQMWIDWLQV